MSSKQVGALGASMEPGVARFVAEIQERSRALGPLDTLDLSEQRRWLERIREPWAQGGPIVAGADLQPEVLAGTSLRVYHGDPGGPQPVLVYLHGGGWTYFSNRTHDRLLREYAARAGIAVLGVDYPLAPEARFPAALDCIDGVLDWLRRDGEGFGLDAKRIVLGGDSAGANLSLATAMRLRDRGHEDQVAGLLLNYGAFDYAMSDSAVAHYGDEHAMLGAGEMRSYWHNYIRDESDLDNPLVCPLRGDLAGLPPTLLVVPQLDVLAEQSERVSEAMQASGADVALYRYSGAPHSFLEAVSASALSAAALNDSADWLRARLR